jgi:hypothetical protein
MIEVIYITELVKENHRDRELIRRHHLHLGFTRKLMLSIQEAVYAT